MIGTISLIHAVKLMIEISIKDNLLLSYFSLGIIRLKNPLDHEQTSSYSFAIEARDSGVGSLPTLATVEIIILDINDNRPTISVSFLNLLHKNTTDMGRTYDLYLPENTQSNKFLAHGKRIKSV